MCSTRDLEWFYQGLTNVLPGLTLFSISCNFQWLKVLSLLDYGIMTKLEGFPTVVSVNL